MSAPRPPEDIATRIVERIALCDSVLGRLAKRDDPALKPLMDDVRQLRSSLQETLTSVDGHRDGSAPAA